MMNIMVTSDRCLAQDTLALKQAWKKINAASCPSIYNFHMHTVCSDGRLTPPQLMQQACKIGLQGMAITDHHTTKGFEAAQSWLEGAKSQMTNYPHLWSGVEITSNLDGVEVHILGYAFDPQHPQILPYLTGSSPQGKIAQAGVVIRSIQAAGGLAVLAHPARYRCSVEQVVNRVNDLGIDGVEAYYAYNNPEPWRPSSEPTQLVKNLAFCYGLFTTCGTDTHGTNLLRRI